MAMTKIARKKLFVNKSRIWNIEEAAAGAPSNNNLKIRSILMENMWFDVHVENMVNIRGSSRYLATMGTAGKTTF